MKKVRKLAKQSLALLFVLMLCFGLLSTTAFAAEVTGVAPTGGLSITKTVVDQDGKPLENDKTKFTFTVKLEYPFWDSPQILTVTLAHGEVWTTTLSVGTKYTVEEIGVEGYVLSDSSGTSGTIVAGKVATAEFTNTVDDDDEPEFGSLTVDKNLVDEDGNEIPWEPGEEFTFTVEFTDPDTGEKDTETFTLTYEHPSKTFKVPDGTTYKVTEVEADGYTLEASEGTEGKIVVGTTAAAVFTNKADDGGKHEDEFGSLTVTKAVVRDDGEALSNVMRTQKFTFTVTLTYPDGTTETRTVTLANGGSETISDLPVGTAYTVTEAGVAGYVLSGSTGASGTIEVGPKTAAFTNTVRTKLPDPNDPDSPDEITIIDDDVPKSFQKVWDDEEEEWIYIEEDGVPRVPMTGDMSFVWPYLALMSAAGLVYLLVIEPKRSRRS